VLIVNRSPKGPHNLGFSVKQVSFIPAFIFACRRFYKYFHCISLFLSQSHYFLSFSHACVHKTHPPYARSPDFIRQSGAFDLCHQHSWAIKYYDVMGLAYHIPQSPTSHSHVKYSLRHNYIVLFMTCNIGLVCLEVFLFFHDC
jgi:hypothetical protein